MYKHLFFDLDHTLWDFDRNSREVLAELFVEYQLEKAGRKSLSFETFIDSYYQINTQLWEQYTLGKIDHLILRNTRFPTVLEYVGIPPGSIDVQGMADAYLLLTPQKPHVFPYAYEVLDYLSQKYRLHIVTNGFADTQNIKLKSSHLLPYFDHIIFPEKVGCKKPDKKIFEYALDLAQAQCTEVLMIGDSLTADIQGAKNARIDHVFFNPNRLRHQEEVEREISCLRQLMEFL